MEPVITLEETTELNGWFILGFVVSYVLIGMLTGATHKKINPDDYPEWIGCSELFWPVVWIVATFKFILFLWGCFLNLIIDVPKSMAKRKRENKKIKEAERKLKLANANTILSHSIEELQKMNEEGKIIL
jgi:Na+/melibiose symporter-like transporter